MAEFLLKIAMALNSVSTRVWMIFLLIVAVGMKLAACFCHSSSAALSLATDGSMLMTGCFALLKGDDSSKSNSHTLPDGKVEAAQSQNSPGVTPPTGKDAVTEQSSSVASTNH